MGIFSKIKDVFKKVVRKVGKIIKKVTKPITKVMGKILAPFNKLFGKLGWVGTLALGIMFPGFGAFGNWLSGMGGKFATWVANAMPKMSKFFDFISTNIVKPFKTTFNSITETFRHGINKVGQAFGFADPGKLTWVSGEGLVGGASIEGKVAGTLTSSFDQWVTDTGDKIFGRTPQTPLPEYVDPLTPLDSDIRHDLISQETGFITEGSSTGPPGTSYASTKPIQDVDYTDLYTTPAENLTVTGIQPTQNLMDQARGLSVDPEMYDVAADIAPLDFDEISEQFKEGKPGLFDKFNKRIDVLREKPVVKAGGSLMAGYGAYSAFTGGGSYDPEFYNENTALAQGMLTQTDRDATGLEGLSFSDVPIQQGDTFNTLAQNYLTGFGYALPSEQMDYFTYAQNMPGYGYQFQDYLFDTVQNFA